MNWEKSAFCWRAGLGGFGVARVDSGWGATRVVMTVTGWVLARDDFGLREDGLGLVGF